MRRPTRMFRGSELSRLLALASLVVLGWAGWFAWQSNQVEKPPPRQVQQSPLPPADDRIEFQGLVDRAQLTMRESPAYKLLVDRARETPPETLSHESRRDLVFSQFLEHPARYRGIPVHIEGTARRIIQQDVPNSLIWPGPTYYEAFVFTGDSQNFPWWLAFEVPPPGLPIGDNLFQPVVFDGYFLKLLPYRAGDMYRYAPLLIGRLRPAGGTAPAEPRASGWPIRPWWILALAVVLFLGLLRWWIFARSAFRKRTWKPGGSVPISDQIAPEDLTAWVEEQSQPAEPAEPAEPRYKSPNYDDDDDDANGGLHAMSR